MEMFANQDFEELRSHCLNENILFVDLEFPPSIESLGKK